MPQTIPLIAIPDGALDGAPLSESQKRWTQANDFSGKLGALLALPDAAGGIGAYAFGAGTPGERSALFTGLAAAKLPAGDYRLEGGYGDPTFAGLGFALGAYRFDRYAKGKDAPRLALPEGADGEEIALQTEAVFTTRDLINIPANDLGPDAFEAAIRVLADRLGMAMNVVAGDELLAQNFPMIHAVGRASAEAPRLVELVWGQEADPKVTLVGKGVTFDTGGLNIKPGSSMALMKKDMGGAANVLGLAQAIVSARLKLRLRVLIPIVENAISGASFRPGDVLPSRKGLTVEIGNTDAEGRLILADALAYADEDSPDLVIDMATLTGAARVALGPDLPPLYARDVALSRQLMTVGLQIDDPLWRMPLWSNYESLLKSKIADVSHISSGSLAGSITAALFLQRFVAPATNWMHLDIFAWAPEPRPGRPFGGTDQGLRALHAVLKTRYGAR